MTSSRLGDRVTSALRRRARWGIGEAAFWLLAFAALYLFPSQYLILNEIAILGLFALSLDLLLGYAGIVSLGHAAFFGLGAYTAGLLAKHGVGEPVVGLFAAAAVAAAVGFATSFLVLRGSDLTRIMVTIGVALVLAEIANQMAWLTGGADGLQGIMVAPVLGTFEFDLWGQTAYGYSLVVTFLLFLLARRVVSSPFGLSLRSIRDNPLRAGAVGIPVGARLVAVYTLAAAYAGIAGALLAQTTQFVSLDVLEFHRSADVLLVLIIGGTGYLYGGLIGAVLFRMVQDQLANLTPQYWYFWIGLILVVMVLVGRERIVAALGAPFAGLARRLPGLRRA
ncbi:branched-chain amino acid ABC transporter permease [Azospirillum sp. ST 5-10]|uniref:branched-chain amino acid ABC transporter permease n=1 Tax=unclassified Azospirillum TaxID=2630922 RepID=UPI003F4A77CB